MPRPHNPIVRKTKIKNTVYFTVRTKAEGEKAKVKYFRQRELAEQFLAEYLSARGTRAPEATSASRSIAKAPAIASAPATTQEQISPSLEVSFSLRTNDGTFRVNYTEARQIYNLLRQMFDATPTTVTFSNAETPANWINKATLANHLGNTVAE